ncbi:MAG: hypothetical protein QOG64_1864 [Acidimicrobiaceae bacterium]|nr:hypothetical protein [Acidimicrobiaceae bacterium]
MPLEPERRQALLAVKASALVRDHWGDAKRVPLPFPGGAALRSEDGRSGWVLMEDQPERSLGAALTWALRNDVQDVNVLVERGETVLARRASAFRNPPRVWRIEVRALHPAEPAPPPVEPPLPPESAALAGAIVAAGADPVVEHGVLLGEVLGLEVCRVVNGYLEVGVGKHDREAQALIHADRPPLDALAEAVATVREFRRADAPVHPANRLSLERWLRAVVCAHPELIGLPGTSLTPAPSPTMRTDLRQPAPAPIRGDGILVVCSTGVDIDVVPTAADAWMAAGRPPRLLIVVPEGDDHAVTHELAAALAQPAEVLTVGKDWPTT